MFRILIIDDDPIIQVVLKRTLQSQGYEVISALNGREGIIQVQQYQPALIVCDWHMPEMDGLEVCKYVKQNETFSRTFFILLTSRSAVTDRIYGLDSGADDFLAKPIDISELKARVRAGLRLYQSAQQLQVLAEDLQAQKQALEAELSEAADYIRSLLPKPMIEPLFINSQFLPSRQLGGDCFDYYWFDPDYLMIYLLDVSGHGLGSALPSVAIQNLLRSQSLDGVSFYQPALVLSALNEVFQADEQHNRYFTIWYGVYNQKKRLLTYASAGHPPAILLSKSTTGTQVKRLRTRGVPIGMLPNSEYRSESCDIEAGSTLYVFSDGIYEIRQPNNKFWNLDAFIDLLIHYNDETESDLDQILQQVQMVAGNQPFEDDCSLLQIKFS